MRESRRYLGIELAGAKNQKTAVAVLEYYAKENKTFLLDTFDRVVPKSVEHDFVFQGTHPADSHLLDLVAEYNGDTTCQIGVNVPLALPACLDCTRKSCPLPAKCVVPSVKWMRQETKKAHRSPHDLRVLDFTAYTQRPIELWVRYEVLPRLPEWARFEIDETLGGNRAPLTARMHFLRRHLSKHSLMEVWPKLSVALLAQDLELSKRTLSTYRHLEEGGHSREEILERIASRYNVFIYERDIRKLAHHLSSFDAFICAYTALLADSGKCVKMPRGFPADSGWVQYPQLPGGKSK